MSAIMEHNHDHLPEHKSPQEQLKGNFTNLLGAVELPKPFVKPDLPKVVDVGDLQNAIKHIDPTKITTNIKNNVSDVTKIVTENVVNTKEIIDGKEVIKTTQYCKQCENRNAENSGDSEKPQGLPQMPNPVGGVLNIFHKKDHSKGSGNGHVQQDEASENKENHHGLLPDPPNIPLIPKIENPLHNLNPIHILRTLILEPIMAFMDKMLQKAFEKVTSIFKFFASKPYLTMPLCVVLMSILTPVFLFILFAFITTAVSFIGFLVAEGTVLAMGGVILIGFLLSFFSVILLFITTFGVIYFGLLSLNLIKKPNSQK